MTIHVLSGLVVAQIAAGEVVERPSSAAKELIENSLDAGATELRVAVEGDGRRRILVSDNGSGIPQAEVELAFTRHATSKLQTAADLETVQTLGFRGEALASISAVSVTTLTTRHADDAVGTVVRVEGGVVHQRRSVAATPGTTMVVENLFYNTPARLKFLKSEMTEKRLIAAVVTRYAMAYPQVRFVLEQDGREAFRSSGNGDLRSVMASALGLDQAAEMLPVADSHHGIRVQGFTSSPALHRGDRNRIMLFVNGRHVQDSSLSFAVVQAYHTLLMTGRYPVAVLMITLPPEEVDVNVHPTKAEVRFRDGDHVFSAVQRAVRTAVVEAATPQGFSTIAPAARPLFDRPAAQTTQAGLGLALESPGQYARRQSEHSESSPAESAEYVPEVPETVEGPRRPRTLPLLRVVGQIGASYIVTEGPAGMYLVDQHAAHERILYEQFMESQAAQEPAAQYTLDAEAIALSVDDARLLEGSLPLLEPLGFDIEVFGPNTFRVRALPAILAHQEPAAVLTEILSDLHSARAPGQVSIEQRLIVRVCKQAAVKAGQILSIEQMQGLIRQLERCESPLTCPHGRPTLIHMSSDTLAREFGRLGA
ncbi:MAG TPA: DNA mismatch repair endonuclease MutL [Candidatus Limnocylindrales bacterium]|nr:DNA mismatch repair endonuclease MutL [Candidatus Limnocylindrales bacterium]